jgi:hypothetical protein
MRFILMMLALGATGYALLRRGQQPQHNAAFADNQAKGGHAPVRDAGPEAMRDAPTRPWTGVDQSIDESFPASDPPGNY